MIEFARLWAFALLPLPVLAWWLLPPVVEKNAVAVPPGVLHMLEAARSGGGAMRALLNRGMLARIVAWTAIIVALAGPETRRDRLLEPTGRDVMVAVDLSASMGERRDGAEADAPRRIDVIGPFVTRLIEGRQGDRVGLIAFGSEAYLIAPMTFDVRAVAGLLPEVTIGLPGRRTDLGQAVGLTVQILRDQPRGQRVLVLVSDGETNLGDLSARDAAELAARAGITVHVVGFSSEIAPENEAHMREIAALTGGRFFEAASPDALTAVEDEIASLLPSAVGAEPGYLVRSWAWVAALAAIAALGVVAHRELRAA